MTQPDTPAFQPQRNRNSSRWVRLSDKIAKQVITIGGIGTIFVVMLVVLVLIGSVIPLFQSNQISKIAQLEIATEGTVLAAGVDEYGEIAWTIDDRSSLQFIEIATGKSLGVFTPNPRDEEANEASTETARITGISVADDDQSFLIGREDGSAQPVTFELAISYLKSSELPDDIPLGEASQVAVGNALYKRAASGLIRVQTIERVTFHDSIALFDKPVVAVDWRTPQQKNSFDKSNTWAWAASDGESLKLVQTENIVSAATDEVTSLSNQWSSSATPLSNNDLVGIRAIMVDSRGEGLVTLNQSGRVSHWKRSGKTDLVVHKTHLSQAGSESKVTSATPLLGRTSFMIGSESGHIEAVSMSAVDNSQELLSIHRFGPGTTPIQSLAASPASRIIVASYDEEPRSTKSGTTASLYYTPTNRKLLSWSLDTDTARLATAKTGSSGNQATDSGETTAQSDANDGFPKLFFSSNSEIVGAVAGNKLSLWKTHIPHPEASFTGFFRKLWYEGYSKPQHVWQSSTGNVEGEYKFGFMPLIYGTLKATFYSMLIGAPIALMAAIFGSEFMSSRWRTRFKPAIELMASIPSVVLGFIGALVLAPVLRDHLMACLLTVPMIMFLFLFGAHCWLLLPTRIAIRAKHWRLPILMILIPLGVYLAVLIAPSIEQALFGGNLMQWLASQHGSGWAGWFCLSVLPMALLVAWLISAPFSPWLQNIAGGMTQLRFAIFKLGFFLLSVLSVFALCALVATLLNGIGFDPRGTVVGPYQERNALLVGCILGFAIIPLIYTISDDALQSVPQHLRSASLGCGATTWQTTIRVVVPTAMSGLFSALMIGFGRAVGETMVVLMAAGNTPLMDMNPLNGYRTLSATLATELPEAARGSTHYHGLFLAALLLFCFTLVANTIAEMVRIRFRKRAFQL